MAKKELNEMTTAELKKQAQSIKVIGLFLLVMLLFILCFSIYLMINKDEIQTLIVIPIALLPVVIALAGNLKKINSEIESRNTQ